jgi:DNA-binding response OmpR family regulator
LIVDDNRDLLRFLERLMDQSGWLMLTSESAKLARDAVNSRIPNAALLDYMLQDGNGVELGVEIRRKSPQTQVIIMTGAQLPPEEEAICQEFDFPVLQKPFLATEVMSLIRARLFRATVAPAARTAH